MLIRKRIIQRFLTLWRLTGHADAKSRIHQFIEAFWLAGTHEFSPGEYWVYGLHMKKRTSESIRSYLPSKVYFSKVLPKLNNKKIISFLENKWLFFLHFKENNIRTPVCFGIYHQTSGFLSGGRKFNADYLEKLIVEKNIVDFIAKPLAGTNGRDIYRVSVSKDQDRFIFSVKDNAYDAESLFSFLSDRILKTHNCGFLIQEYIEQHKKLKLISPSASMNIRIVTLMRPNGEVVVTSASTRIGRIGSVVSNAGSGGLLAKLDPDKGTIVRCRSNAYIDALEVIDHPDTGERIVGSEIPFWKETMSLCYKAACLIPDANSIGWDVLIDANGPILLEGNHDWDVISEQLFGEGYLTESNVKLLNEHGLDFPKITISGFRPRKVLQFIR